MAEPPLDGRRHDGAVTVRAAEPRGMIAVKAELGDERAAGVLAEAAGLAVPETGGVSAGDGRDLLWMAPDEVLLILPPAAAPGTVAALEQGLAGQHGLVADVSDMRAAITLEGAGLRNVLAKLTPADLSPDALPPGRVRRTRLGQAAAAFWLRDERTAEVLCFRSVAGYVFDLLADAAQKDSAVDFHRPG